MYTDVNNAKLFVIDHNCVNTVPPVKGTAKLGTRMCVLDQCTILGEQLKSNTPLLIHK